MSSAEKTHKTKEVKDSRESTEEVEEEEVDEEVEETEEEDAEDEGCIDLSQNEIYRGVCTLLEDEQGNNILEYISLLHTELIGINKSMENLRGIRKDLTRLADVAELFLKGKSASSSGASVVSSATSHHEKSERSKKSTKA